MSKASPPAKNPPSKPVAPHRNVLIAGLLLALATLLAYSNSFSGPFVYDDVPSIKDNPTITKLSDLATVLSPPNDSGITVNGRPLLNLSLAINYAIGQESVRGYHVVNLAIHLLAGLALFGVVRRALQLPAVRALCGREDLSLPLAFAVSLIWTLHPLQTESVTYIIQRAESMVGLFYLTTFYCFLRAVTTTEATKWEVLTVVSCLLGMASKEVMASAPLMVLLFDRAAVAGSFQEAWARRRNLYIGLAMTWLPLAWLVQHTNNRGGTAGFRAGGVSSWDYAVTSAVAIGKYIKLVFWPANLVFDYGTGLEKNLAPAVLPGLLLVAGVIATGYALWRRPLLGFLGIWFFAILGPSSSIIPIASETMAEHRMYLPLVALVVLIVVGLGVRFGRGAVAAFVGLGLVAGVVTYNRNRDYSDEMRLWRDAQTKYPSNARAHNNVGEILYRQEKTAEALECFREAVRLLPNYDDALNNVGNTLTQLGDPAGALPFLERALALKAKPPETHNNLGSAYYFLGKKDEALRYYAESVRLNPKYPDAHNNLGLVLFELGRLDEAIEHYQKALQLRPDYIDALYNYGNALNQASQQPQASATEPRTGTPEADLQKKRALDLAMNQFEKILSLKPNHAKAHNNLGTILFARGQLDEAERHFRAAIQQKPDYADAHANLGLVAIRKGRPLVEAVPFFEAALKANPNHGPARRQLSVVLNELGAQSAAANDLNKGRDFLERAIAVDPANASAFNNLGVVYLRADLLVKALPYFEEAVRLKPDYPDAQKEIENIRAKLSAPKP